MLVSWLTVHLLTSVRFGFLMGLHLKSCVILGELLNLYVPYFLSFKMWTSPTSLGLREVRCGACVGCNSVRCVLVAPALLLPSLLPLSLLLLLLMMFRYYCCCEWWWHWRYSSLTQEAEREGTPAAFPTTTSPVVHRWHCFPNSSVHDWLKGS